MDVPMSHHLKSPRAYSINDLGALFEVSDLELLLEEYRRLLVRGLYDARDKNVVRRRRGWMKQRKEINGLIGDAT